MLSKVQSFLGVSATLDYSNLTLKPDVSISLENFIYKVTSFTLQMGRDFKAASLQDLGNELLTYKLSDISGAARGKINYIMFILQSFRILISEEIIDVRSEIGETLYIV